VSLLQVKVFNLSQSSSPGKCSGVFRSTPPSSFEQAPSDESYAEALEQLDIDAVREDVLRRLTDSDACWPADFGNYGPLFIRQAFHCAGTYAIHGGVSIGGCGGGRQRFEPEVNWDGNVNLDKARALLLPIKEKYGIGLSWGDLITFAGTVAARSMGAPVQSFCFGRTDDSDGTRSLQNALNMEVGPVTINALGKHAEQDLEGEASTLRYEWNHHKGFDDRQVVALLGGGHTFGKGHGACSKTDAFGLRPSEAYALGEWPYQGLCGTGVGNDTYTTGFVGAFTRHPTTWDNEYFTEMFREWELWKGPGGVYQWRLKDHPEDSRMRTGADMALMHDPGYLKWVKTFSENMTAFDEAWDEAWTMLITRGGRWSKSKKCDGAMLPEWLFLPYQEMMLATDASMS